jgi:hypothetical protein
MDGVSEFRPTPHLLISTSDSSFFIILEFLRQLPIATKPAAIASLTLFA